MFGPLRQVRDVNPRSTTSMYGHGKSDKPILPLKLANKGGCEDSSGASEGKGLDQGQFVPTKQVPDPVPGRSRYGEP